MPLMQYAGLWSGSHIYSVNDVVRDSAGDHFVALRKGRSTTQPRSAPLSWQRLADSRGLPRLHGPYVVEYTDVLHDGDILTLWTPAAHDVLLALFPDHNSLTQWDHGRLTIQQPADLLSEYSRIAFADASHIAVQGSGNLVLQATDESNQVDNLGHDVHTGAVILTNDPVQIKFTNAGADPTQGHVEIYCVIARALAP